MNVIAILTGINHHEMTSSSVTVFARLANIRDGVNTVKTTLFISLRALVVRTLLKPEARYAPTRPMGRTWMIGIEATRNNEKKPIVY